MSNIALLQARIPAMTPSDIDKVRRFEAHAMEEEQVAIGTLHLLHGGMYARTIRIPAGVKLTGALIKIATILVVSGDALVFMGDSAVRITGYNTLAASANRKQAFVALVDTDLTMIFPSQAVSVAEAEDQFTDEADMLFSRKSGWQNHIVITGE